MNKQGANYKVELYKNHFSTQIIGGGIDIKQQLSFRAPYINQVIKCHFPENHNMKILDLGCGYGAFLYYS